MFVCGHYLSEKRTVFRERSSRKAMGFEEQIMSTDKYPNIFARQVYYPSNVSCNTRGFQNWRVSIGLAGEYSIT